MLRLRKGKKKNDVLLVVVNKTIISKTDLFKAFSLAIGFHLIPFIFFQVKTFLPLEKEISLPLVSVQIETGETFIDHRVKKEIRSELFPSPSQISLVKKNRGSQNNDRQHSFISTFPSSPLFSLKRNPLVAKSPVKLSFLGPLVDHCWFEEKLQTFPEKILFTTIDPCATSQQFERVEYSVILESQTGSIFWYDLLSPPSSPSIFSLCNNILKSCKFHSDQSSLFISGIVVFEIDTDYFFR